MWQDFQIQFFGSSQYVNCRPSLIGVIREKAMQNVDFGYRMTPKSDDDVPFLEAGLSPCAPRFDGNDQNTAIDDKIVASNKPSM